MSHCLNRFFLPLFVLAVFSANTGFAEAPKPKYGSNAILLSQSHEYLKHNAAPDYWVISPYYVPQQDGRSCSLASVTMIVNAARSGQKLTVDDELATQAGVLKRVNDEIWNKGLSDVGHGISLDQLKPLIEKSLKAYNVNDVAVTVVHTNDTSEKTKKALHQALVENEKSAKNFIIANFNQKVYTDDAEAGHIAPIAAYDAKTKRVLIMDPDRLWYEPYWVSEDVFLNGMATHDKTSDQFRGYVTISILK